MVLADLRWQVYAFYRYWKSKPLWNSGFGSLLLVLEAGRAWKMGAFFYFEGNLKLFRSPGLTSLGTICMYANATEVARASRRPQSILEAWFHFGNQLSAMVLVWLLGFSWPIKSRPRNLAAFDWSDRSLRNGIDPATPITTVIKLIFSVFLILKCFFINHFWDFRAEKFLFFERLVDLLAYLEKNVTRKEKT